MSARRDVPDYGQVEGWLSADLMISGLQLAGANPTRTSFIDGLRTDTSYTGGGLLPNPVDYEPRRSSAPFLGPSAPIMCNSRAITCSPAQAMRHLPRHLRANGSARWCSRPKLRRGIAKGGGSSR